MENSPILKIIIGIIGFLILVIVIVIWAAVYVGSRDVEIACTTEAKLCPDGTYVGRTGPNCEFSECPSLAQNWETLTDSSLRLTYNYPTQLPATYISATDWPPRAAVEDGPFICTEAGSPTDRAGQTQRVVINSNIYCVTTVTEGAAGSIYNQYAYATEKDNKVVILTFSLRFVQCSNYAEPNKGECEIEQRTFDIDTIVDSIMMTLRPIL